MSLMFSNKVVDFNGKPFNKQNKIKYLNGLNYNMWNCASQRKLEVKK